MGYLGNNALPFDPIRSSGKPRDAERFSGNGSTLSFTLNQNVYAPTDLDVFVENVRQEPIVAYDVIGKTLTFTEAPPTGTNNVYVVYRNFDAGLYTQIPDGSVSYQKLANNIRVFTTDNYTGDNATTSFALTERPADANTLFVSIDGVVQRAPIHYTVSNTTITFASAPPSSSNVHVRHLGFRTTSTITALAANTTISQPILQNLTATGTSTFTGNVSIPSGVVTNAFINTSTINAGTITGNTTIPNGSQLRFNTASVIFDVKPVTGATDVVQIRSQVGGTTYPGLVMDAFGRVTQTYLPGVRLNRSPVSATGAISTNRVPYTAAANMTWERNSGTSNWRDADNSYVCPLTGFYAVFMNCYAFNSGGTTYAGYFGTNIARNGSTALNWTYYQTSGFADASSHAAGIVYCSAGDYLQHWLYPSSNMNNVNCELIISFIG